MSSVIGTDVTKPLQLLAYPVVLPGQWHDGCDRLSSALVVCGTFFGGGE